MLQHRVVGLVQSVVLITAVLVATAGQAEIPRKINYQGRITDAATGDPLPGSHDMTFRIFDVEFGGAALWTEQLAVTADAVGVVSVILGSGTPIEDTFDGSVWLEVEVDGQVLEPRRELVSVPYALRAGMAEQAANADSLGGLAASSFVHDGYSLDAADGDPVDALYVDNDGAVGVGTTNPTADLHVYNDIDGTVRVTIENPNTGPNSAERLSFTNEDGATAGIVLYDDEHSTYPSVMGIFNNRPGGNLRLGTNSTYRLALDNSGNVGIGTMTPEERLHVAGNIRLNAGGSIGFAGDQTRVYQYTNDLYMTADDVYLRPADDVYIGASGGADFVRFDTGNQRVGIGRTSPVYTLDVAGRMCAEGSDDFYLGLFMNADSAGTGVIGVGGNQVAWTALSAGVGANGYKYGLFARANQTGNHGQAAIYTQLAGPPTRYVRINYLSEGGTHYKINGDGLVSTVLTTSQGQKTLICPESPEAWIEDYGSGEIVSGSCHVELDPLFLDCVTVSQEHPLKVLVTLTSRLANQFYVEKGLTGFDVIVAGEGAEGANATFDYKVVAKWKDHEQIRFEAYQEPEPAVMAVEPERGGY